jgi:DNA-binding winged helix-turn-helix (wHTH) protein/TolB-like protein
MTYRFGIFAFDDRAGVLTRSDRLVALEPQPARALALLLSRAGELVRRDELIAHLWGGDTHVDFDRGLAYCIGQLRAALGDSADNPRFVQTLPRRGFRFIAPVERAGETGADGSAPAPGPTPASLATGVGLSSPVDAAPREPRDTLLKSDPAPAVPQPETATQRSGLGALVLATAAVVMLSVAGAGWWTILRDSAPDRPIVAVAVFENETGDASRERAVAGIADAIVERLTALGPSRIGVNGNSKVLRNPRADRDPRAVARETHASFLVAGHLQTKDGRLSLLMHIIRLDDGTHVWVQRLSRSPDDALNTLDEDVAAQIEEAVRRIVLKGGAQAS